MKVTVQPLQSGGGFVRTIEPYIHTFHTHVKARWIGKSLLDVYCDEFGGYSRKYYESAIQSGKILLSQKLVSPHHILQNGQDVLSHTVHLHEPAVILDDPDIHIIEETDDIVVVDKPPTMVVHPTGTSRYNSLQTILELRLNQKLYSIHRLDRVTSGICLFAKSPEVAQLWSNTNSSHTVHKYYLARVKGKFPLNLNSEDIPHLSMDEDYGITCGLYRSSETVAVESNRKQQAFGYWTSRESLQAVFDAKKPLDWWLHTNNHDDDRGWLNLACPTRIAEHKDGICMAGRFDNLRDDIYRKTVKASQTAFGVVAYCSTSDSTVVVCKPTTGRSHQIRLHLQFLGHPIAVDAAYGGDEWFANPEDKATIEESRLELVRQAVVDNTNCNDDCERAQERQDGEGLEEFVLRTCRLCRHENTTILRLLSMSRGIWLRAIKYQMTSGNVSSDTASYVAKYPEWANVK